MKEDHIRLTHWAANKYPLHSMNRDDWHQEVFLRVLRKYHYYDQTKGRFSTWVSCVVSRLRLEYIRNAKKKIRRIATVSIHDVIAHLHTSDTERPDIRAMGKEDVQLVREAITELPPDQAEAIIDRLDGNCALQRSKLQDMSAYRKHSDRLRRGIKSIQSYVRART